MKRVLHILPEFNPGGGMENVIMNYFRTINKKEFSFDVITHSIVDCALADEFVSLGGRIQVFPAFSLLSIEKIQSEYRRVLEHGCYDVVHCHMANAAFIYLRLAKKVGVPIRILHSHQNKYADVFSHAVRNKLLIALGKRYANRRVACSKVAGDFLFGRQSYTVLPNAISTDTYKFDKAKRVKLRSKLGIPSDYQVIGNVGRLVPQKNQAFLISLMPKILKKHPNTLLMIVGEGPLYSKLRQQSISAGVDKHIYFLGMRSDVPDLLNVMDVFVFPSLYEGLGEALVEAQANGLPAVVSTNVPAVAQVNSSCIFMKTDDREAWVNALAKPYTSLDRRYLGFDSLRGQQYDIEQVAKQLEWLYN